MKIEKAIEILQKRVTSPFVKAHSESVEATQLGIEALVFFKGLEDTGALPNDARLPGETKG